MKPNSAMESHLGTFSALDKYFAYTSQSNLFLLSTKTLVDLAKEEQSMEFFGLEGIDVSLIQDEVVEHLCFETEVFYQKVHSESFINPLDFSYDPITQCYSDTKNIYPLIRGKDHIAWEEFQEFLEGSLSYKALVFAIFISRYPIKTNEFSSDLRFIGKHSKHVDWPKLSSHNLRLALNLILEGKYAERGLAFLHELGFFHDFFPDLIPMDKTSHSKECHPEGNVWIHSLACLAQRKEFDLELAWSIWLHDCGKPYSAKTKVRFFDGHAEKGEELVLELMDRLEFLPQSKKKIAWFVKNHMYPGMITTLPMTRTAAIMESELFPELLELYRCDLGSTFRGLKNYHSACARYKAFVRYRKNPYRNTEGKITSSSK